MAEDGLPNSTPSPPQAISAASPFIQFIMSGIEELITKHLSQLSISALQSQPGNSKDPNYSKDPTNKDGGNPVRERTSSISKMKLNARFKQDYCERSHFLGPATKNAHSKPALKSASRPSPSLSSFEVTSGSGHSSRASKPKNKKTRRNPSDSSRSIPRRHESLKPKRSSSVPVAKPPPLPPVSILTLRTYSLLPYMPLFLQVKLLMNLMFLASLKYLLV